MPMKNHETCCQLNKVEMIILQAAITYISLDSFSHIYVTIYFCLLILLSQCKRPMSSTCIRAFRIRIRTRERWIVKANLLTKDGELSNQLIIITYGSLTIVSCDHIATSKFLWCLPFSTWCIVHQSSNFTQAFDWTTPSFPPKLSKRHHTALFSKRWWFSSLWYKVPCPFL